MDPTLLRDHLRRLQEELQRAPQVDAASTQLLGELTETIKQLMVRSNVAGGDAVAGPDDAHVVASLPARLEQIAVMFEVEHPMLAASSRRLVDLLGKVGL